MKICTDGECSRAAIARGLCSPHYQRWVRTGGKTGWPTEEERLWSKVDKNGPIAALKPDLGRCWMWIGGLLNSGYGQFHRSSASAGGKRQALQAHRVVYERTKGPIPDGLVLDHFACERPACVNPDHVRPVTQRENLLRSQTGFASTHRAKERCLRGHEFTERNTRIHKRTGARECRACHAMWERERRARLRAQRSGVQQHQ